MSDVYQQVLRGELSQAEGARQLGIPRTTVRDRVRALVRGPVDVADTLGSKPAQGIDDLLVVVRDYSNWDKRLVYPLGDVHVGAPEHARERWQKWLRFLAAEDDASLLFTGDGLNCAIPGSKSDVHTELMAVGDARRQLTADLEGQEIDVMLRGNHEARVWRATGDDPLEVIAEHYGVPYAPGAVIVVYLVGDQRYVVYARHGTGAGATAGGVANSLRRSAEVLPSADIVLQGHTHHQLVSAHDTFALTDDNEIRRYKQYHVSSGSFTGYARYAAEKGFPASHVGAPRIYLDGRRHDVHVSV